MKDIYLEKIMNASVSDGIVTVVCGVTGNDDADEETVRIRIPLSRFQRFSATMRDILIGAMNDGWFGEEGKKAVDEMKGVKGQ